MPVVSVPQSTPLSMEAQAMGAGYGQGIVPMTPRPAPTQINIPRVDVPVGNAETKIMLLQNYDLMGQGITPGAQYLLPNTYYGSLCPSLLYADVSGLERIKSETMMGRVNAHQPTMNFGGDPRFEAEMTSIRPTNPRALTRAPTVNVKQSSKRIPIRELPLVPASTQPRVPNVGKLVGHD